MRRQNVFIAILFLGFLSVWKLSGQVTCTATAQQQVVVGQQFTFTFSLNQQAQQITSLQFPAGFEALSGPNQSSYRSIINGQTTQSFSYSYTLRATKEGSFTVPAATFVANGQSVNSNTVAIQVVAAQQAQQQQPQKQNSQGGTTAQTFNKEDFFVKASVSNANPYVGEQVIVNYKLYINPQVYGYQGNVTTIPSSQGFWTYDLNEKTAQSKRYEEVVNGKRYVVEDFRSIAAYPQKSGKLTITPLAVDLIVQVPVQQQRQRSNDPFDIFFNDPFFGGGTRLQNVELKLSSNAATITARETPTDRKPADYSGLVGNFTLTSKLSRNKLSANDAANLSITVSGSGNLQYIDKLNIEFPSDIDVQEPNIKDNIKTSPTGISGSRTFEYVLIPRSAGKFTIPAASFSYFDKGKNCYVTLSTNKMEITVEKGKDGAAYARTSNKKDLQVMGTDIRHIKTNAALHKTEQPFFLSLAYWIGLLLPIFLLIVIIVLLRKRIENQKNKMAVKDKRASKLARKRLNKAEKLLKNKQDTDFYIEISQALWGYVCDKFRIPLGQLSLDTAAQKLKERSMDEASINEFLETLNHCEQVRFAPTSEITPEKMYERTFNFITKIERELKK
jgi:hypothetical protein